MSEADRNKWQGRYLDSRPVTELEPDEELLRYRRDLPASGRALDLACGLGKNSLYLAQHGLQVNAVDISQNALDRLMQSAVNMGLDARIEPLCVDLDAYRLGAGVFELIVVVRFLNRELFAALQNALKPGGVLLYKTFNRRILKQRPGFNPDFTIETVELIEQFDGLERIVDNSAALRSEYAFLLARKPGAAK